MLALNLSLLTRLVNLRQLELRFKVDRRLLQRESDRLRRSDFAWIRPNHPKAETPSVQKMNVPFSRLSSVFRFLFMTRQVKSDNDFSDCLEAARANTLMEVKDPSEREGQRQKMSQLQKENSYRTDYDRDIPMVDGLAEFESFGSPLDVEACLQAQVWRLKRKHHERGDLASAATETTSLVESTRPWKDMEQFIFTINISDGSLRGQRRL